MRQRLYVRGAIIAVAAALFTATTAPAAHADEFRQVTGGFIEYRGEGGQGGSFILSGDGFTVTGQLDSGRHPGITHSDLPPGTTFSASNGWSGLDIRRPHTFVYEGSNYENLYLDAGTALSLSSGPYVVPSASSESVTITAPFTLLRSSKIVAFNRPAQTLPLEDALFNFGIFGSGLATSTLYLSSVGNYFHSRTIFQFNASQPAPTPEPTTLLLLGTAAAGLGAARRWRRASSAV